MRLLKSLFCVVMFAAFGVAARAEAASIKIVVYGGRGNIGGMVVTEALNRGDSVVSADLKAVNDKDTRKGLTQTAGDIMDSTAVARQIEGADVVVVSLSGKILPQAAKSVVAAMRTLGAQSPRLIWFGGSGTLHTTAGGPLLMDLPQDYGDTPGSLTIPGIDAIEDADKEAHDYIESVSDMPWAILDTAQRLSYGGPRTGKFRLGGDVLVRGPDGESRISGADIAVAIVDEAETPKHNHQRFTLGY